MILSAKETDERGCRSVVRLKTAYWKTERGLHCRKDLIRMRRLSFDFQILEEDSANIGVDEVLQKIVNLSECKDGLYTVATCNERHDWETGYLDDYDYRLVPFES